MLADQQTVLLTGATGIVGGGILYNILKYTNSNLYCLIRNTENETGYSRLISRLGGGIEEHALRDRVRIVEGDLTKSGLGISVGSRQDLIDNVSVIVNCAANTSFIEKKLVWQVNVDGLGHLIEIAGSLPKLKQFVHFGSAAASGIHESAIIHENTVPDGADDQNDHYVEYTKTKMSGERLIRESLRNVDSLILRPSYIVPDEVITPSVARTSIYPLLLMKECGALPIDGGPQSDVVPQSFVSAATLELMARPNRQHDLYQISAGPELSPRWSRIMEVVAREFGTVPPVFCGTRHWRDHEKTLSPKARQNLRRIRVYFHFINQNTLYSHDRLRSEITLPPAEHFDPARYLPQLLHLVSMNDAVKQSMID